MSMLVWHMTDCLFDLLECSWLLMGGTDDEFYWPTRQYWLQPWNLGPSTLSKLHSGAMCCITSTNSAIWYLITKNLYILFSHLSVCNKCLPQQVASHIFSIFKLETVLKFSHPGICWLKSPMTKLTLRFSKLVDCFQWIQLFNITS